MKMSAKPHAARAAHAVEQDRPDILKRHEAWFEGQLDLDPERLVFIDETWASTNMAHLRGRLDQVHITGARSKRYSRTWFS